MSICLIGLGSNLGDTRENLDGAVQYLRELRDVDVLQVSEWMVTPAVGGPKGQAEFLNGAVRLETPLSAVVLLAKMQEVEQAMGRYRDKRWGPRLIDLDLLLYDSKIIEVTNCRVPHPWFAIRRFALQPAAEIAGDTVHPEIGLSISQLMEHLESASPILSIASGNESLASYYAKELAKQRGLELIGSSQKERGNIQSGSTGLEKSEPIKLASPQWQVQENWPGQVPSKLVVLLKNPEFDADESTRHERLFTQVHKARIPWLELSSENEERVLHDLTAAITTMQ